MAGIIYYTVCAKDLKTALKLTFDTFNKILKVPFTVAFQWEDKNSELLIKLFPEEINQYHFIINI